MPQPSPIHRNPDTDGDDFGCVGPSRYKGNRAIVQLIETAHKCLNLGEINDGDDLIDYIRDTLEEIEREYDCGCCDTVVKENVLAALAGVIEKSGLEGFDRTLLYGW